MLRQSTLNLKSRILDCFDFLQKSRNDGVGGIVIAICFAFCAVIARFDNVESWQSKQALKIKYAQSANPCKSFCFVLLLQNEESPYPIDSNLQSEIPPIRSWVIYFTHCVKSRALDTSLHCVSLSMTKMFGLPRKSYGFSRNDELKRVVILSLCKRRSIHFGDFRILRDSLTLGESKNSFGLLRRLQRLAMTNLPTASLREFASANSWQSTSHTTFKGIKMQT